jgi:hypothetical protein
VVGWFTSAPLPSSISTIFACPFHDAGSKQQRVSHFRSGEV